MKKIKSLLSFMLVMSIMFIVTGCRKNISEADYKKMIDSFVSTSLNTYELTIGDEAAPQARVWLQDGNGTVYSSDEKVVTITELGKVTAVGEGSAYIVITDKKGTMFEVYRYDVYKPVPEANLSKLPEIPGIDFLYEIENFDSTGLNTYELKIGESHTAPGAVWAQTGSCYTSDPDVITIAENGNVFAQGRGTAYVVIKAKLGNIFKVTKYLVKG